MEVTRECSNYKEILLSDERVEWSGCPGTFPLLSTENKTEIMVLWIGCTVIFAALAALYAALLRYTGAPFNILVILVLAAAFAYIISVPMQDRAAIQKKHTTT